jgi:hypothetical protein
MLLLWGFITISYPAIRSRVDPIIISSFELDMELLPHLEFNL